MAPTPQAIYIVSAIHCPAPGGLTPNCYSITGAYDNAAAAQKAMFAKAKELYGAPLKHWHGNPTKCKPEWNEAEFKVEFKGPDGDFGVCWIDERVLGVEEMPITKTLKFGRFGLGHGGPGESEDWGMNDEEVEKTLCSLLKF